VIVDATVHAGEGRTAFMPPALPDTLPTVLRCPGEDASVRPQPGRPDTP